MTAVRSTSAEHDDLHLPGLSDAACLDRLHDGDLHGFGPLYDHHHRQVERFAATVAGSHVAVPLAGEAFARLALLLLVDRRRPGTAVRYFLYAALRESCRARRSLTPLAPAAAEMPPLTSDWRELLGERVAEHLGVGCRSGDLLDQIICGFPGRPAPARARHGGSARG